MLDNAPSKVDPLYESDLGQNVVVVWGGTNDMRHWAHHPAVVYSRLRQYCLERRARGYTVVVLTLAPPIGRSLSSEFRSRPADAQQMDTRHLAWVRRRDRRCGRRPVHRAAGLRTRSEVLQPRPSASEQHGTRCGRGPRGPVAQIARRGGTVAGAVKERLLSGLRPLSTMVVHAGRAASGCRAESIPSSRGLLWTSTKARVLRVDLGAGMARSSRSTWSGPSATSAGKACCCATCGSTCHPRSIPGSPENPVFLVTGPFAGTNVSTASRLVVGAKSPVTGILDDSYVGGSFAPEMKFAGYDLIIITGKAPEPSCCGSRTTRSSSSPPSGSTGV